LWKEFIDFHKEIDPFYTRSRNGHIKFGEYVERQLDKKDSLVLVGLCGGKVVAYAISRILKHPPVLTAGQYGDIVDLAVTANHRRKGVGNLMLDSTVKWFQSRGLSRAELRVAPQNHIGYSFWRKHGFKECTHTLYRQLGSNQRDIPEQRA
jgi:ribosomal protein S18 acetylase RimI-like enzyme